MRHLQIIALTFLFYLPVAIGTAYAQNPVGEDFLCLQEMNASWSFDMRYATDNNFLDSAVYPCERCLLRSEVALALCKVNDSLQQMGYQLHFFDCYRPLAVQKQMWAILPDARYVANPYGNGSSHNRGAAVDLTLADAEGKLLDMGTDHDFFGEQAHHAYTLLPQGVLENRLLLKQVMAHFGFKAIKTEWWHYSYSGEAYPIADVPLCETP